MGEEHTAILYHGGCPDGFGGAYAAWKKFGDDVEYIPVKHGQPAPEKLDGKNLYFIDFCYQRSVMDEVAKVAKSVTVLDHHEGVRDTATKFPGVFDPSHSGAIIAWNYFHQHIAVPKLFAYVEDGDLYRFALPNTREILAYAYLAPFTFERWDALAHELDDPRELEHIISAGTLYTQYHEHIVENGIHHAELVQFEGYECYLTCSLGEFISDTGHRLVKMKPPLAILVSAHASGLRVSLRSDASVDVSILAQKYGGNGHPAAAGFRLNFGDPIPWKLSKESDENSRD